MTLRPLQAYHQRIRRNELEPDPAQERALAALERLYGELTAAREEDNAGSRLGSLIAPLKRNRQPAPLRGVYLWGGVGRGKSMLMDLFFEDAPVDPKRRVHFHAFMQEVQAGIQAARSHGSEDPINEVADKVAASATLLCFDEFQVTDITDAMILGRLFEALFARGVVVVATSNRHPDDLYKDGLNRPLFEPFIALIKTHCVVHELASGTDYRQGRIAGRPSYFTPVDRAAREAVRDIWAGLGGAEAHPLVLRVKGRGVDIPAFVNGVARASFYDLCGQPLGAADYLALAEAARVLILEDIPQLGSENFNQARRFVTLIDALYEARVKLVCTAAAPPDYLYVEGTGAFEFERTASRLREMQAEDWGRSPDAGA